jgi:hypothetical protein
MGSVFTPKQRQELHRRLKMAICWKEAVGYQTGAANMATTILDELEHVHSSAALGRRAVDSVIRSIEKSA